jgi:nickel transport protein
MDYYLKFFSIALAVIFIPVFLFAHGVEYSTFEGGIGFTVKYNTGQLITGAHVKVYSPGDSDELYQWGVTDLNGRFVFSPDKPGEWLIEINDGSGHGIKEQFTVSGDLTLTQAPGMENQTPVWQEIVIGVSIIFGFTGIWFYRMAKRSDQTDD